MRVWLSNLSHKDSNQHKPILYIRFVGRLIASDGLPEEVGALFIILLHGQAVEVAPRCRQSLKGSASISKCPPRWRPTAGRETPAGMILGAVLRDEFSQCFEICQEASDEAPTEIKHVVRYSDKHRGLPSDYVYVYGQEVQERTKTSCTL